MDGKRIELTGDEVNQKFLDIMVNLAIRDKNVRRRLRTTLAIMRDEGREETDDITPEFYALAENELGYYGLRNTLDVERVIVETLNLIDMEKHGEA